MKIIYLVRHAKSSWADPGLMDIERPLNNRGKQDAPFMAKKLKEIELDIDLLVTSPARRARKTAKIFSIEFFKETRPQIDENLYHASAEDIMTVIKELDNSLSKVAIFGHNPGFTYLANYFSEDYIANVPTCGIVGIQFHEDSWANLENEKSQVIHFIYPKMYMD